MHPADIKASLHKNGSSASQIARSLGIHRSTVSEVISGKATSRRIAERIASILSAPIGTIWPGKYVTAARARRAKRSSGVAA